MIDRSKLGNLFIVRGVNLQMSLQMLPFQKKSRIFANKIIYLSTDTVHRNFLIHVLVILIYPYVRHRMYFTHLVNKVFRSLLC